MLLYATDVGAAALSTAYPTPLLASVLYKVSHLLRTDIDSSASILQVWADFINLHENFFEISKP